MSDVVKSGEVRELEPPTMLLLAPIQTGPSWFRVPQVQNHGPGQYCTYCSCQDCRMFYATASLNRRVDPQTLEPSGPKYTYMDLVNSMRAAAAKREEERQDKLRAEREGTAAAAMAPTKDKTSKVQNKKKNLRRNMKRRRQ